MTNRSHLELGTLKLEYISTQYKTGDEKIKDCIDVAFVENLFWRVPTEERISYWEGLPENLKELYVNFHQSKPL